MAETNKNPAKTRNHPNRIVAPKLALLQSLQPQIHRIKTRPEKLPDCEIEVKVS